MIHPSKTMRHFDAKTVQADSTLKQLHPLYFSIRISQYSVLFKDVKQI
jgi:hypothetical protein